MEFLGTVPITNTGKVAGKETVELYVGQKDARIARPACELKGFEKIDLLPGETTTLWQEQVTSI